MCPKNIYFKVMNIFSSGSFPPEVLEFQPFCLGLLSISTDFNVQCEVRIKYFCLHVNIQLFCRYLVKWQPLPWLNCFNNSGEKRLNIYVWVYLRNLCSVSLNDMLTSILFCVDYRTHSLEIKYCKSSYFVQLFQSCFGYFKPFSISYQF